MKALLLLLALLLSLYLARVKARDARNLMTNTIQPEMLVNYSPQETVKAGLVYC